MKWALQTTADGMLNDAEFCEVAGESFSGLQDHPGLHGTCKASIKTQQAVMENLDKHHQKFAVALVKMEYWKSEDGRQCWEDSVNIKTDLVAFVRNVLENTAEIDDVLMHMEEGIKYARMLRAESSREKPRNRFLRIYTNRSFEHLKKSELSEDLTRKLKEVEEQGLELSVAAQQCADRLDRFAMKWRQAQMEEQQAKVRKAIEEEADNLRKAQTAAKWSFFGTVGLVALSVVGAGIAAACVAATGGAALGPVTWLAAHAGALAAGATCGGCAIGAVKTAIDGRLAQKQSRQAQDELDKLQEELKLDAAGLASDLQECIKLTEELVQGYKTLSENVKKTSSQTVALIATLKFACTGVAPVLEAAETETEDDDEELEMVSMLIMEIEEDALLKQEQSIKETRARNLHLKNLALRCYEEYCGLAVGSTKDQEKCESALEDQPSS